MTNVRAVGPLHLPHRPQSWASDLLAVLLVAGVLFTMSQTDRALSDAEDRLAQAVIERDFALREQERVETALAKLRQQLNGCLNGDGMTTTGSIDNVHFAMVCKPVKGL